MSQIVWQVLGLLLAVMVVLTLASCRSHGSEGDGFGNNGAYAGQRLCQKRVGKDIVWYNC